MNEFKGESHAIWMQNSKIIVNSLQIMKKAENIGDVRFEFRTLSKSFIESS